MTYSMLNANISWQLLTSEKVSQLFRYSDYRHSFANISPHNLINWVPEEFPSYIAELNGNLLIKTVDIVTYEYKVWLIGTKHYAETIKTLLDEFEEVLIPDYLCESVLSEIQNICLVEEDALNKEYIYSSLELSKLEGSIYSRLRNIAHRFCRERPTLNIRYFNTLEELNKNVDRDEIANLFDKWSNGKKLTNRIYNDEKDSLFKLLDSDSSLLNNKYIIQVISDEQNNLVAVWVGEVIPNESVIVYYAFYDSSVEDISYYAYHKFAETCFSMGIPKINVEQDLGIEGLRAFKLRLRPIAFQLVYKLSKSERNL